MAAAIPNKQHGIKWNDDGNPEWTIQPDIKVIQALCEQHLATELHDTIPEVTFFAEGGLNKLFEVSAEGMALRYLFRVSMPVDPYYKIESEVATMRYLRENTSIPVPQVVSYCSSITGDLGFEWILLEKMPGVNLETALPTMPDESKKALTRHVSQLLLELQQHRFSKIGSLYEVVNEEMVPKGRDSPISSESKPVRRGARKYIIGRSVHLILSLDKRVFLDADRGPYDSCEAYITALVNLQAERFRHATTDTYPGFEELDKELAEKAEDSIDACNKLRELIPNIFGDGEMGSERSSDAAAPEKASTATAASLPSTDPAARFVLNHPDLSDRNILVDPDDHTLTGIIDWEYACTHPLWENMYYPDFLAGREVDEEDLCDPDRTDENAVEMREEHELTQRRRIYDETIRQLEPWAPRTLIQDRSVRLKWKFRNALGSLEERGAEQANHFMDNIEREYWVRGEKFGMGLYVPGYVPPVAVPQETAKEKEIVGEKTAMGDKEVMGGKEAVAENGNLGDKEAISGEEVVGENEAGEREVADDKQAASEEDAMGVTVLSRQKEVIENLGQDGKASESTSASGRQGYKAQAEASARAQAEQ